MKIELMKRLTLKDRDGKIIWDSGLKPSHSFVIAFLNHVYGAFDSVHYNSTDVDNASQNIANPASQNFSGKSRMNIDAPEGDNTYGIVVGLGNTAETSEDYALETLCADGNGANELNYSSVSMVTPVVLNGNVDLVVARSFLNSSGSTIGVEEIGIYCESAISAGTACYFCIARDVLGGTVNVADTITLSVEYRVRTEV